MIQVTDVRIEPNPAAAGGELEIEITIEETYSNAKRYPGKYPHRYAGIAQAEGRKYPYKYQKNKKRRKTMKKIVFNDSRQIEVQSVTESDGVLHIRIILVTTESLKALFGDTFATQRMTYFENQQQIAAYENYTQFKYIKEETGGVFEVEMRQTEADTDERLESLEETTRQQAEELKKVKEEIENGGGNLPDTYMSVFTMAKMSAEEITNDEQALKVSDLYDAWSGEGVAYKTGKYLRYNNILYKVLQNHTSQADWTPDTASSLYAKVLTDPDGKVLPWEQPNSTNPYKKVIG